MCCLAHGAATAPLWESSGRLLLASCTGAVGKALVCVPANVIREAIAAHQLTQPRRWNTVSFP